MDRKIGVVRLLKRAANYGFIEREDDSDVFFVLDEVKKKIGKGDKVSFYTKKSEKDPTKAQAYDVQPIVDKPEYDPTKDTYKPDKPKGNFFTNLFRGKSKK